MTPASGPPGTHSAQQFYVTHCVKTDSVLSNPGWSVRAASTADLTLARQSLEYPPYELPMDMWSGLPSRNEAPRRLARIPAAGEGMWVVNTSYLEKDTMGRDRAYFTHALLLPAVGAIDVLRSWAAPGWTTDYPQGAPQQLGVPTLPRGTAIGEAALAAFAGDAPVAAIAPLATTVCPPRLAADPARRRDLLARFLAAFVASVEADASPRGRLYVHAEPGLVALLLFAAARLLPPGWTNDLTFTTYEPAHRGLREYKHARVVGTYFGNPAKGLDPDLASARGFGIDTFQVEHCSPEFRGSPPVEWAALIELAAAGDWSLIDRTRRLLTDPRPAPTRFAAAVDLARALTRLNAGTVTAQDLIRLKANPDGAAELTRRGDADWPLIRAAAAASADVRAAFRDDLRAPARLLELREAAKAAVVAADIPEWDRWWNVVRGVTTPTEARGQLASLLKELAPSLLAAPPDVRTRLRRDCADLGQLPATELLTPTEPAELTELFNVSASPADWRALTSFLIVGAEWAEDWLPEAVVPHRPALREEVRKHLRTDPYDAVPGFLHHARKNAPKRFRQFLAIVFDPPGPDSHQVLDQLLGGCRLSPNDWEAVVTGLDLTASEAWEGYLAEGDRLAHLLPVLEDTPTGRSLWEHVAGGLTPSLFEGDADQVAQHAQLMKAVAALQSAGKDLRMILPKAVSGKLSAAQLLFAVLGTPPRAEDHPPASVQNAFRHFWPTPAHGLRAVFRNRYAAIDPAQAPGGLAPFASLFATCFPAGDGYRACSTCVNAWLAVVHGSPHEAVLQLGYFKQHVPQEHWRPLFAEPRQIPIAPWILDQLEADVLAEMTVDRDEREAEGEPHRRTFKARDTFPNQSLLIAGGIAVGLVVLCAVGYWLLKPKPAPDQEPSPKTPPVADHLPSTSSKKPPAPITPRPTAM